MVNPRSRETGRREMIASTASVAEAASFHGSGYVVGPREAQDLLSSPERHPLPEAMAGAALKFTTLRWVVLLLIPRYFQ